MQNWLATNREKIDRDLPHFPERRDLSPILFGQYRIVLPLLTGYTSGKTIDVGCGTMPFKPLIADGLISYDGLDLYPSPGIQDVIIGNVQDMSMLSDALYDSAICLEVLEHIPDPRPALEEIWRILKPGGTLIFSVPHLSRLHEVPHDYYRFTSYGLQHLLRKTGFDIEILQVKGGILSFVGHQISIALLSAVWSIPVLRQIAWFANKWAVTRLWYALDRWFGFATLFPSGYAGVARKPTAQQSS
jgi:SAM-dependent methyltransferase